MKKKAIDAENVIKDDVMDNFENNQVIRFGFIDDDNNSIHIFTET